MLMSKVFSSVCLCACLCACLHDYSETNDPKVIKLGIWNDLRISYKW